MGKVVWRCVCGGGGGEKQCLVRLPTYVNDISVELKAVRQAHS